MTTPGSRIGASTASRVPTTTSTRPSRIRRHVSRRSPSDSPRVDQRNGRVQVGPQPVDQGGRQRNLGDEDERRAAGLERRRDRLDVHGRSTAAGHAVDEERLRVAVADRASATISTASRWPGKQRRALGPGAAEPGSARRERVADTLADLDRDEAAPHEAGHDRRAVRLRQSGRRDSFGPGRRERFQGRALARSEWSAGLLARQPLPSGF